MPEKQDAFYELAQILVDTEVDEDRVIEFADRRFVYFHTDMFAELFENMKDVAGPVVDRQFRSWVSRPASLSGRRWTNSFVM